MATAEALCRWSSSFVTIVTDITWSHLDFLHCHQAAVTLTLFKISRILGEIETLQMSSFTLHLFVIFLSN